jgi:hypothetical protein
MEEYETRFEDLLIDEKHIEFFTLSATPFRNSIGENSGIQGILIMQHFACEFLAALFLLFFFHGMLVFS